MAAAALLLALTPSALSLAQPASVGRTGEKSVERTRLSRASALVKPDLLAPRGEWVPGQVLVRMPKRLARHTPSARTAALGLPGARIAASIPAFGVQLLKLSEGMRVGTALGKLSARGVFAEPNKLIFSSQVIPTDERFGDLWGLHNTGQAHPVADPPPLTARGDRDSDIDAVQAWAKETGSPKTVIAVLDAGLVTGGSPTYPASYTLRNIVSVAATNHRDHLAYYTGCAIKLARYRCAFTNWGRTSVDLAAPGVDVLSTTPLVGKPYKTFNGTSMAAPHVAGVAGLVKSSHPSWGARAIKNALLNSADRPGDGRLRKLWAFPGRSAEFRSAFLIARAPHDGCEDLTSPATPATCGAAIEVPLKVL